MPLFFFFSIYYLRKESWARFLLFDVLALAVIEAVAVVIAFEGIYLILIWRREIISSLRRTEFHVKVMIPIILIALSVSWYGIQDWFKSTFFPVNPSTLSIYLASSHWSVLGVTGNPLLIPLYVILNPGQVIAAIEYDAALKAMFLLVAFAPLLFIPLRNSYTFVAASWLVPVILSNYPPYYLVGDQYPAFIIPFLFVATVIGLKSVSKFNPLKLNLKRACVLILTLSLVCTMIIGPYSPIAQLLMKEQPQLFFSPGPIEQNSHVTYLDSIASLVPADASILTQNNMFVHFSNRLNAYALPWDSTPLGSNQALLQYMNQRLNESQFVLIDIHPGYSTPSSVLLLSAVVNRS
ncbi:MAG: DUF2079 domain-containing protein, partial [Nitrosopumilaceae archaeon]